MVGEPVLQASTHSFQWPTDFGIDSSGALKSANLSAGKSWKLFAFQSIKTILPLSPIITVPFAYCLKESGRDVNPIDPAEEIATLKSRLAKLKAAQVYAAIYHAKESIAGKKREREKLLASGSNAEKAAAERLGKQIAKEETDLQKLAGDYEKLKSAALPPTSPLQQSKL